MTPAEILREGAKTFEERNAIYKDNYIALGPVMGYLFPDGVTLRTSEDHIRFHLFLISVVKMTRYAINWKTGHQDSLRDASVYLAMLEAYDTRAKQHDCREDNPGLHNFVPDSNANYLTCSICGKEEPGHLAKTDYEGSGRPDPSPVKCHEVYAGPRQNGFCGVCGLLKSSHAANAREALEASAGWKARVAACEAFNKDPNVQS